MAKKSKNPNPLAYKELEGGALWVLAETPCSNRRVEFLKRGNTFISYYYVVAVTSNSGFGQAKNLRDQGKIDDQSPMKISTGSTTTQMTYHLFKKYWQSAGQHLTNQTFLMIYGNFEAYIADLLMDALDALEPEGDSYEGAKNLLIGHKWEGKISRIDNRLDLGLKGRLLKEWFKDIELTFLGAKCSQPLDYLEKVSDLRDRVVHYGSRVDVGLQAAYPSAGFKVGDEIFFPFDMPSELHLFLMHLSDLIDEAFCEKFGWERLQVKPETLV
jgi:hypothetical protein